MVPPRWCGDWDLGSSSPASRHGTPVETQKQVKFQSRSTRLNSPLKRREFVSWALLPHCHCKRRRLRTGSQRERETIAEKPWPARPTWGRASRSAPWLHEAGAPMCWGGDAGLMSVISNQRNLNGRKTRFPTNDLFRTIGTIVRQTTA